MQNLFDKLLYVEKESLEILAFRMINVHRVIAWLIQTVKDPDTTACLSGS